MDETNYLELEARANDKLMHPLFALTKFKFKFHPGDWVVLKRTKHQLFKDKVSLTGYDMEEPRYLIKMCTYRQSGRGNNTFFPFYQLDTELWVSETEIALRQCPHQQQQPEQEQQQSKAD